VFGLISEYPEAGPVAEDVDLVGVRRILMAGTQHYLYYRPNYATNRIEVLAVWSTSQGELPPL
jgi:plasmid stabilization system protein ParE